MKFPLLSFDKHPSTITSHLAFVPNEAKAIMSFREDVDVVKLLLEPPETLKNGFR